MHLYPHDNDLTPGMRCALERCVAGELWLRSEAITPCAGVVTAVHRVTGGFTLTYFQTPEQQLIERVSIEVFEFSDRSILVSLRPVA